LARLEQQQIDAAGHEVARLLAVEIRQFVEGNLGKCRIRGGDEHPGRSEGSRDEAGLFRRADRIASIPGEPSGGEVDLGRFLAQTILVELETRGRERVGLDDVGAGGEVGSVNLPNEIRPRQHEGFVTAMVLRAAEIVVAEAHLHELGAHGTVEDQDAVGEGGEIRIVHFKKTIT